MQMNVTSQTLANILQTQGVIQLYHVPKYQRGYTWRKHEWEQMLNDIEENDVGYFVGSIICVGDGAALTPGDPYAYEVVDGQQRLTTLSIMLMSIYRRVLALMAALSPEDEEERDDHRLTLSQIKGQLVYKKATVSGKAPGYFAGKDKSSDCILRVQPSTQKSNLDDYTHILHELDLIAETSDPGHYWVRLLYKAYTYFYEKLPKDFAGIKEMLQKIHGLTFAHISVTSSADAFVLFESLNNRGIPLYAIDIIKNKMLANLEKKHDMPIDAAFDEWQKLLEYLPEYQDQERFLRQHYNAFNIYPHVKIDKFSKAIKGNLIKIYEKRIADNAKATLDDLLAKAEIYHSFLDPDATDFSGARKKHLLDLGRAGAAPSYLFLLYLCSLPAADIADRNPTIDAILVFFIKYYVRRNITDVPSTRDLDTINIAVIEKCDEHIRAGNPLTADFVTTQFLNNKEGYSNLATLKNALADNLFSDNRWMARFVLARLGEEHPNKESQHRDLWAQGKKSFVWTVEHIFPQGKNIPGDWVDMLANGDKEKAQEIQESCVHCLGNLTLSGYNPKLSNSSFEKKQNLRDKNGVAIGYKNGSRLNNLRFSVDGEETSLAKISRWTKASIMARNDAMVGALVKEFAFDDDELNALKKDGGA